MNVDDMLRKLGAGGAVQVIKPVEVEAEVGSDTEVAVTPTLDLSMFPDLLELAKNNHADITLTEGGIERKVANVQRERQAKAARKPGPVTVSKLSAATAQHRKALRQLDKDMPADGTLAHFEAWLSKASKLDSIWHDTLTEVVNELEQKDANSFAASELTDMGLRMLGRLTECSIKVRNRCGIDALYRLRNSTVSCPKCQGRVDIEDLREVSAYRASYPDTENCPFCIGTLDRDASEAEREAAKERCEMNPQYDEDTGKLISCDGKGFITKWRQAWAHHTCTACVNEARAGGRAGRGRSVKYT